MTDNQERPFLARAFRHAGPFTRNLIDTFMSSIRTTTGLFSGIDIGGLTDKLIEVQRAPAVRLESRRDAMKKVKSGVETLEANLLGLSASVAQLNSASLYSSTKVTNSDSTQIAVTAKSTAALGTYSFQVLNLASAEQRVSKGFTNTDKQLVGAGEVTIARGGHLNTATRLSLLNGGLGVKRGSIKITDRAGKTATIDLSKAYTVDDVLGAINEQADASVTARTDGGKIVLTDTSAGTASNLIVQEIGTGRTAQDLGIKQSVASNTLTGSDVYYVTSDFTLDQLNDGNGVFQVANAPDLRVSLKDGTNLDVNLDNVTSLSEFVKAVNTHASNSGKVTAALSNGRLVLTDNTVGTGTLSVSDLNGAAVTNALGLDNTASGNVLTGDKLLAGLGSRLLRNLRGGKGITQTGQISLTDRTGRSATVDLTGAESLDQVLTAINSAESSGTKLALTARVNSVGSGIEIVDTSGSTASNLIVSDVGASTLATQLGIAVNGATTSVNSGSLNLRRVNENTSLSNYAPDGSGVDAGSFIIVDSAGNQETISVSSNLKTLGEVMQRINTTTTAKVRAELNETGDGFRLIDQAGGAGTLKVQEVTGSTAADLRILGTGAVGTSGAQEIQSRQRTTIAVTATDTLSTLIDKINTGSKEVVAGVVNDGSAFNSNRLSLSSKNAGTGGQLIIDSGSLDLGLSVIAKAQDAKLQVGASAGSSFLVASSDNVFKDVATGVTVTAQTAGTTAATVDIAKNTETLKTTLKSLVTAYNSFVDKSASLSAFDTDPAKRGPLQGQGVVLRIQTRLSSVMTRSFFGSNNAFQTLSDVGLQFTSGGKLKLDEAAFDTAITKDPEAVKKLFIDDKFGAAKKLDSTLKSLTDVVDGTFAATKKAMQETVDGLQTRIDQIDSLLTIRRVRLLNQFIKMESTIGSLQTQQNAVGALAQKISA